jgi:hypothetical protein
MSFFKLNKLGFMVASAALLALAATQGCSSDDDSQAAPSGGSSGKAGSGNAGKANGEGGSGDTNGEGGSGNVGNSSSSDAGTGGSMDAGAGGEAGGGNNCTGADGCYSCTPSTSLQFENGCVAGGCPDTFTDHLSKIALVGTL